MDGESESGDACAVVAFPGGVLVAVVDGLGHGPTAAAAARAAITTIERAADLPLRPLIELCHSELRRTRGVVLSLASLHVASRTMTWAGVGNVDGVLFRADGRATPPREALLPRGGIVGYQLPALRETTISLTPGDTLVMATDGLRPQFEEERPMNRPPQAFAEELLALHGKRTDDALVLVLRYLGAEP